MGIKLLHISDIHFKDYKGHDYLDLDKDIQSELELDLEALKTNYQKIDIILIGGDIAFSGSESEYLAADAWIKKICQITGCQEEFVLTVPGNHDVDRKKITPILESMRKDFKSLRKRTDIDTTLGKFLTDPSSSSILFSPFHNYSTFAQKYGSLPDGNNSLFWEKDFNLDGCVLRIRGVNSALVSEATDDENISKMILGSHQSIMQRNAGVINVVLCHHPPQWLYDGEEVKKDFRERARIHLFGHKHSFDAELLNNKCLVLSAGAMQPSRNESNWEPRYNIIELGITAEIQNTLLNIVLYKRKWNKSTRQFGAEFSDEGKVYEDYSLKLTDTEVSAIYSNKTDIQDLNVSDMTETLIDPSIPNPKRKLAFMFLGLPYHVKLTIAVKLELIENSDRDLNDLQKTQNYFKRASSKKVLYELWNEVMIATDQKLANPFPKNQI